VLCVHLVGHEMKEKNNNENIHENEMSA